MFVAKSFVTDEHFQSLYDKIDVRGKKINTFCVLMETSYIPSL
jgi:hypothetical protein